MAKKSNLGVHTSFYHGNMLMWAIFMTPAWKVRCVASSYWIVRLSVCPFVRLSVSNSLPLQ